MLYVGKIDLKIYACVSDEISTDEVVITQKQIEHIFDGHMEKEHEKVIERLAEALVEPDYLLRDPDPHIAVVLKQICGENDERYRIILKLASNDPAHPKNSVITAFFISEKKWNKYLRNKQVLYTRPGL